MADVKVKLLSTKYTHPLTGARYTVGDIFDLPMEHFNNWLTANPPIFEYLSDSAIPELSISPLDEGGDLLPPDFPSRELLVEAGYNTVKKVAGASNRQLEKISGLGRVKVKAIREALNG